MKPLLIIISLLIVLLNSGCATIFLGTKQKMSFKSSPPAASVKINGEEKCKTPCTTKIRKGKNHEVLFMKKGYRTRSYIISEKRYHWLLIPSMVFYLFGSHIIDAATHSGEIYTQDTISCQLIEKPVMMDGNISVKFDDLKVKGLNKGDKVGWFYNKGGDKKKELYYQVDINYSPSKYFLEELSEELLKIGYNTNSNAPYSIRGEIEEIEYNVKKLKGSSHSSTSKTTIKWIVEKDGKEVFSNLFNATANWGSKGSTSIERAVKLTYFKFLNSPELSNLK